MVISNFRYENKALEWKLEEISFNRLTLLVGASGVGKTQMLRALMSLQKVVEGGSLNGVSWEINFKTLGNKNYKWIGEFEQKAVDIFINYEDIDLANNDKRKNSPKIIKEQVFLEDKLIVERTNEDIIFNNIPTIKLSQQESVLHLLKEEEVISHAYKAFKLLVFTDHSNSVGLLGNGFSLNLLNANKYIKEFDSLEKIQGSDLDIAVKLFLVQKNDEKEFLRIKKRFFDIFPQVEDIKVAPLEIIDQDLPDILKDYPFIQIREKGVKYWISQNKMSSGMFRTLMQLSELYLCADGTVFLIDEFENSLGINCINEITGDILSSKRKVQFILTSHHPYIIDSIDIKNWKLVTRNAGIVKVHDLEKYDLEKSKHSAFMQLLQLEEYQTGQE